MNHSRLRIQANTQHNSGADNNKMYHYKKNANKMKG